MTSQQEQLCNSWNIGQIDTKYAVVIVHFLVISKIPYNCILQRWLWGYNQPVPKQVTIQVRAQTGRTTILLKERRRIISENLKYGRDLSPVYKAGGTAREGRLSQAEHCQEEGRWDRLQDEGGPPDNYG